MTGDQLGRNCHMHSQVSFLSLSRRVKRGEIRFPSDSVRVPASKGLWCRWRGGVMVWVKYLVGPAVIASMLR